MWKFRKKNKTNIAEKEHYYTPPSDINPNKPSSEVTDERFEYLLEYAYEQLPEWAASRLNNVSIVVDDQFNPHLLGLFSGVPLTKQTNNHTGHTPSVITIYRETLKRYTHNELQLYEQTRKTLFHEIGHYFGMGHDILGKHGY